MKYKSNYTLILQMEEKKISEKEMEIADVVKKRNEIIRQMEKEEEKSSLFRSYLSSGKQIDGIYFTGAFDEGYERKLKTDLEKIDTKLKVKRYEFQALKEKKKVIEEMDKKEEKSFYEELRKKEQKKIIGIKAILKNQEESGGETE